VTITAPRSALHGTPGLTARGAGRIVLGTRTVQRPSGAGTIAVTVALNANGRLALKRNAGLPAKIALSATTTSGASTTGSTSTTLRLPRQTLSPIGGIFAVGSTQLNAAGRAYVDRLASVLPAHPEVVQCTGYTDSTGVPGDNRWLGAQRATALCSALAAAGVEPHRTEIVSKGATSPRAPNTTDAGRADNRRAAVLVTY
jgi:outer membrane protein OmpA-like peptidoglycan-associated protein